MSWLKQDDGIAEHPKTRRVIRRRKLAGLAAFGLHGLAMANSSRYLLDGHVPSEFVEDVCDLAGLRPKETADLTASLVASGQWTEHPEDGWLIHDYLDHNPSRAEVEAKREADRKRKATGGRNGKPGGNNEDSDPGPEGFHAESGGSPHGIHPPSESPVPYPSRPVPSNNPPDPPKGGRRREVEQYELELARWSEQAVPEATEHYRLPGVRHAMSVYRAKDKPITAESVRWYAGHGSVNAFGLTDEDRAAIRREFVGLAKGEAA